MENAAPTTPPAVQTTQLFLSTAPSSVEYNHVLRMVGRDVSVTLVERGAEGIKLELPTGQVITAKGDLPFPEGTQLQVRVSVQNDLIKLQTLEAKPPSPASILGPLSQSEAAMLLQKLQASDLAEALLPLAKLFAGLAAPKEAQIQRAIESLPVSSQQILSLLLGLKDNNPALLSRTLIERFEPIASLMEMNSVFTGKEINDISPPAGNEYKLAENRDALINNLREIFLKYFESGSMKQITISNPGQYKSVFESLKSELLFVLTPLLEKTIQNPTHDAPKSNITEQIIQTLKLLPENVRNNISDSVLGRSDSNIEVIAKAIIEKLEINTKNVLISTESRTGGATAKQEAQRLMQLLESMPSAIRRIIAAATLGNAEAEPKVIAEFLMQKGVSLNFKQGSFSNQETLSSILRQIITMLPNETRNNISTAVLGKVDSDIEAVAKAVVEKIDANIKNAGAVIP
ncbi:MAG: hypothetical protein LBQ86_06570, partial [Holophagales bacterium]|nr:hypothetical protein [Holophagales bacterium]